MKLLSILGEGGEGTLSSKRWGEPAISARVCQLRAAPCSATISWPACRLAIHTRSSFYILSHLANQVKSSQLASGTERKLLRLFLITFLNKWRKWYLVPGFIGIVYLIAGFLIQDCLWLLFKWNLITRYPVVFSFRVGTGRVLKKKFGTGRVPGSRRTLVLAPHPLLGATQRNEQGEEYASPPSRRLHSNSSQYISG